ncbi:transporter substrate-binding domain-containing protein [Vibrio ouci]|uniref:Transporter substrate-binding domain-containing protein n=1 Tax=Vibrio ouci TaxID=2499078 RepID=A0A4Y8WIY4_9VIBR|nr:transporter substrate-binding domain-containing protein [Vibrio ouci]
MSIRGYILFCVLFFYAFSISSFASVLRVAQTAWPPFIMNSPQGRGIAHDLVMEGLINAGSQVEFVEKPWARILKETLKGKSDVIVAIWKTPKREQEYLFTEPYMYNQMAVVSPVEVGFEYHAIEDLKEKRVAMINGYAYAAELSNYQHMYRVSSIDLPNSIRLLLSSRADVLVTDEIVGRWTIKEMGIEAELLHFSQKFLDSSPVHVAVRRTHPQAQEIVNALNLYFKQHGAAQMKLLREKYGVAFP